MKNSFIETSEDLMPNEYIVLKSEEKKSALGIYRDDGKIHKLKICK